MKKLTIKETEDKVLLQFDNLNQLEADYWEGIYLKQLYYNTIQSPTRKYSYIDVSIIRQMLSEDWYIDFHIVNKVPIFTLKNYPNEYMYRWYGDTITLNLLAGYPIEFTKMQFTDSGEIVL